MNTAGASASGINTGATTTGTRVRALRARHLYRRLGLFALTSLLLLTAIRAGFCLWQLPRVTESGVLGSVFLQGIRIDITTVALVLLPLIPVAAILSAVPYGRWLARWVVFGWLLAALAVILLLEGVTLQALMADSLRPSSIELATLKALPGNWVDWAESRQGLAAVIGLAAFATLALYMIRLAPFSLLPMRLRGAAAGRFVLGAGLVCALGIAAGMTAGPRLLLPSDIQLADDTLVNELALNTSYKVMLSEAAQRWPALFGSK